MQAWIIRAELGVDQQMRSCRNWVIEIEILRESGAVVGTVLKCPILVHLHTQKFRQGETSPLFPLLTYGFLYDLFLAGTLALPLPVPGTPGERVVLVALCRQTALSTTPQLAAHTFAALMSPLATSSAQTGLAGQR